MADATLLSWITAEVDQALAQVREKLARFAAQPGAAGSLRDCAEHLHQVSGALRMVGLAGATRFCEQIETGFERLNGLSDPGAFGIIDRAVLALKNFVGDVSRGAADMPLRLLAVYRELGALTDAEVSERDLFYPDLSVHAPAHQEPLILAEGELTPFLRGQRARLQRGLLAALRNPGGGGLKDMEAALDALHRGAAHLPEPRAIPWVALGVLDGMAGVQDPTWLSSAKALCNKLDFHVRDLVAGATKVNETLLREALYAVAKSSHVTERIRAIRELYQLEALFAEPAAPAAGPVERANVAAVLAELRSRLHGLKSAWVQYLSGEPNAAMPLRELLGAFRERAAQLDSRHLSRLVDAIALAATRLPDPYPQQKSFMVMEMASAFLLADKLLESFSEPPADLEEQIGIMGGWLLDAADGNSTGEPPVGLRPDLTQQIGTLQLRAQVAREVLGNLQYIEQALDGFSRDATKRDSLHSLEPHLRQIHGAFAVLGMDRAAELLTTCETLIAALAAADHSQAAEDLDWIAEGLSTIGVFLEPCLRGREPAESAVARFLERYERRAPARPRPVEELAAARGACRPDVDPELLGVYLDEAGEVLSAIAAAMEAMRERPDDREALVTIRRSFHTLKGSGRMVGLMDLGEAAWEIERVLNGWIERGQAATAELLELIEQARSAFVVWIARLRDGSLREEVDSSGLASGAATLIGLEVLPQPPPGAAEPEAPQEDEAPREPVGQHEVKIGDVTLAADFYEIYRGEAQQHIATLVCEFRGWQPGSEASFEFMRAAHTLASSSLTAGFSGIAAVAGALEKWLPCATRVTDPGDVEIVENAIHRLGAMVQALAKREPPASADEEERALQKLSAKAQAASPPASPASDQERERRVMRDDVDEQLLPIFLEEAQELLPQIGSDLREWKSNPTDPQVSQSLRRGLHTLKGSARMAGAIRLGELTHLMESRVEAAIENRQYAAELFAELEEKLDRLSIDVERMSGGERSLQAAASMPASPASAGGAAMFPAGRAEAPLPSPAAVLRVSADTLDQLINGAGEISIARSRVEAELRVVRQSLGDLNDSIARLRGQLREVEIQADSQMQSRLSVREERAREFDPLEFDRYTRLQELTRLMAESVHDVVAIQQTLAGNLGEADAGLLQQARTTRDVQHELMRMRAVPFSSLSERLYRVVRQAARELGKKAELELEGGQVELDRSVLERIAAPLEHMLRNALAHGIEAPETRLAAGKPEAGRISIALRQEANEVALVLADDGAGLDLEKLERRAIERGLLPAGQNLSDAERMQLIFLSGLSTVDAVSELAGRGVGMDVVRNEVAGIGGRVDITTSRGRGTSFAVYLPLTLAVTQAVLVRAGGRLFAVPSAMVEQVLRVKGDALASLYEQNAAEFLGRVYPLRSLDQLLGARQAVNIQLYNSVLLLRSGIQRIAIHVDELIGNQEIVVKTIGPQLSRLPGVAGATVLADGAIVLIINPVLLAQRARGGFAGAAVPSTVPAAEAPRVMVVDDSLTVRRITSRLLEREGYRVTTAKDGVDALEQLKDVLPDVMLVDIEMPRMDGFDLTRNVRSDPRSASIPIIVISSRTAEKHRTQATQLGVNAFLGKPYQDSELLQQVARHLGR